MQLGALRPEVGDLTHQHSMLRRSAEALDADHAAEFQRNKDELSDVQMLAMFSGSGLFPCGTVIRFRRSGVQLLYLFGAGIWII